MNMVSFWLVPDEIEIELWQPIIDTLANHYNTPQFLPHVTVTLCQGHNPLLADKLFLSELVSTVASQTAALELPVGPVQTGENFFQCVFARIPTAPVRAVADSLATQLGAQCPDVSSAPTSNAHLSLIYSNINSSQRKMLATQIIAPSTTLKLSRLCAVLPGTGETDFSDPDKWEICAEARLGAERA